MEARHKVLLWRLYNGNLLNLNEGKWAANKRIEWHKITIQYKFMVPMHLS